MRSVRVFGRWSGPADFTIDSASNPEALVIQLTDPFFYGEWITVSLSHAVRGATGDSLTAGYVLNYWTKALPGALDLVETARIGVRLPGEVHVQTYGAYAGDLNDDGWTDLAAPNELSSDVRVFLNDGAGEYDSFTIHPLVGGASPSANEGADFDNDGFIDLAVGNGGNDKLSVLIGDGVGGFVPSATYTASASVRGIAVIDINSDGSDDIITANRNGSNLALFVNDGSGSFLPPTFIETGGFGETAIAVADANNDGIQDVFVGALSSQEFFLLLGDGAGGLTLSSQIPAGGAPWMITVGDVNNDGAVDLVSANSSSNSVSVSLGDGAGGLLPVTTYPSGAFTLAIDLGDLDGDGDLDMVSSNFSGNNWNIYENFGDGTFGAVRTYPASSTGSCAVLHDRDNDGDLDMTGIDETDDLLFLFDNIYNGVWFTADTVIGQPPLTVSFTGITNRIASQWSWDFGDDSTSTLQSPSHTYTSPGQYRVGAEILTPEGTLSAFEDKFVAVYADSVIPLRTSAPGGQVAQLDIYARNYVDLLFAQVAVRWSGGLQVTHTGATTAGLRSEHMTPALTSIDPVNKRLVYSLTAPLDTFLAAGSGPILTVSFLIPSGAAADSAQVIVNTNPAGVLEFITSLGNYSPVGGNASLVRGCCQTAGDATHDGAFNIADVIFGVARIFSGGPAPLCQDEADANADNLFNIADVTFGVARIFSGGPAPICGQTGR